jgi:hypothetical protein
MTCAHRLQLRVVALAYRNGNASPEHTLSILVDATTQTYPPA